MNRSRWYGRDLNLQFRMLLTMLLLTAVYLIFATVLFTRTHFGPIVFIIPLVGLVFQYYFSDKIVLGSMGARVVDEQQAPQLYSIVQRLAQQADLPMPKIALMDTPMPNAFATGRNPKHAVVCVTTGLMNRLPPPEVEAVLAHEMTHIRNRDVAVMTMAGSFAAVASYILQWGFWFGMGDRNDRNNNGAPFAVILLLTLVVTVISHMLVMTLSRYREYAADRGSAILTGAPEQLESALLRITGAMQGIPDRDLREAQPAAALFIASPSKAVMEVFSDHPPVEKRINRLQALSRQMATR